LNFDFNIIHELLRYVCGSLMVNMDNSDAEKQEILLYISHCFLQYLRL